MGVVYESAIGQGRYVDRYDRHYYHSTPVLLQTRVITKYAHK